MELRKSQNSEPVTLILKNKTAKCFELIVSKTRYDLATLSDFIFLREDPWRRRWQLQKTSFWFPRNSKHSLLLLIRYCCLFCFKLKLLWLLTTATRNIVLSLLHFVLLSVLYGRNLVRFFQFVGFVLAFYSNIVYFFMFRYWIWNTLGYSMQLCTRKIRSFCNTFKNINATNWWNGVCIH